MAEIAVPNGDEIISFQGRIVELVKKPMKIGNKEVEFELARRSPGTRLIIVNLDNGRILLTKEHRTELDDYDYRLPGGKVFDSLNEYNEFLKSGGNILAQAKIRAKIEAQEEAGIKVNSITHEHTSINGATMEWDLHYFIVDEWIKSDQQLEPGEDISIDWYSFDEAWKLALKGNMQEDRSVAVLLRWLYRQKNKVSIN